ncbi:131_t:CDS:2, partial [Paraglomus occultum]
FFMIKTIDNATTTNIPPPTTQPVGKLLLVFELELTFFFTE